MMNPTSWTPTEVEAWARQVGLSDTTVSSLTDNEIDGPTLVTLEKEELRSELGIVSLPARRYLWDLILTLRAYQGSSDRTKAVDVLEEEIDALPLQGFADASAGGGIGTDEEVVNQLRNDAAEQRQIISDHLMALRLKSTWGQQTYEDAELARSEEERLRQLAIQSEFDRRYAQSLRSGGRVQPSNDESKNQIASLFGLSIQACVSNKVNVAEALANGQIRVIPRLQDLQDAKDEQDAEDMDIDQDTARTWRESLPIIIQCHVCYENGMKGVFLACDHSMCVECMRNLFLSAVRDSSLLPLRCCETPIDMTICHHLLSPDEAQTVFSRLAEREATNKMYCPSCNMFINLDLVDAQESTDLLCMCGTALCVSCKTVSHPRFTCAENKAIAEGDDTLLLEHARQEGWKQCPRCNVMIELTHGCNHITCRSCDHQFCFLCLSPWGGHQCSTRRCALWDEARLLAAGEARVDAEDVPPAARQQAVQHAMRALRANEGCRHNWTKRWGNLGECERCGYSLHAYGMRCSSDCESTVCFTCARFRIPRRGWR